MTRDEWFALAERCETATGPDREIAEVLARALGWTTFMFGGAGLCWKDPTGATKAAPPRYDASLDAITALIDQDLPEWGVTLGYEAVDFRPEHKPHAVLWMPGVADEDGTEYLMTNGRGSTLPLALCAAFCRAMGSRANG